MGDLLASGGRQPGFALASASPRSTVRLRLAWAPRVSRPAPLRPAVPQAAPCLRRRPELAASDLAACHLPQVPPLVRKTARSLRPRAGARALSSRLAPKRSPPPLVSSLRLPQPLYPPPAPNLDSCFGPQQRSVLFFRLPTAPPPPASVGRTSTTIHALHLPSTPTSTPLPFFHKNFLLFVHLPSSPDLWYPDAPTPTDGPWWAPFQPFLSLELPTPAAHGLPPDLTSNTHSFHP